MRLEQPSLEPKLGCAHSRATRRGPDLGDRQIVYLPAKDDEGLFVQRTVQLGAPVGDGYAVRSWLRPGDVVVTEGSFFLRAEAVRNHPS